MSEKDEDIRLRKGPSTATERATYPHATAHIIEGHTDAIWSVALLRGTTTKGFISASADGTTRVWKLSPAEEKELKERQDKGKGAREVYWFDTQVELYQLLLLFRMTCLAFLTTMLLLDTGMVV